MNFRCKISIICEVDEKNPLLYTGSNTNKGEFLMKYRIVLLLIAVALLLCACGQEQIPTEPTEFAFSAESGFYPQEFQLTIGVPSGAKVLYTTDGSDPATSTTATVYESPISVTDRKNDPNVVSAVDPVLISGNYNKPDSSRKGFVSTVSAPKDSAVDKCTVIRAIPQYADGSFGQEKSGVYFIGTPQEHLQGIAETCEAVGGTLAVISISMNYEDLFAPATGIYVKGDIFENSLLQYLQYNRHVKDGEIARSLDANYKQRGRAWEREATVTMFEFSADGAQAVLTQKCGIRIQGNYSRSDLQKGLRLFAREEYGSKNFSYPVFGEDYVNDAGKVMDKFDTLVLRAGGNCAFTAKFNDAYWQSLVKDMACETKESRPCIVYLNGEYWGLYVLEEDYTDDYLEDLHGVNKDDVVIYKGDAETYDIGYKLDEGEIPAGAGEDYYFRQLLDFFDTHKDLSRQEDYDAFVQLVDPESVKDYFAVQCWINNKWDWPGKNWSMWKTVKTDGSNPYADGRWRFMFYDMEFGGVSGASDAYTNTIKEDNYKPKGLLDRDTNNPAVLCFVYLMTNEGFREGFYTRLKTLSHGNFGEQVLQTRLQEFKSIYTPLYNQFFQRYPGSGSAANAANGGYASIKCIRDFIGLRKDHIQQMIDYCEKILD